MRKDCAPGQGTLQGQRSGVRSVGGSGSWVKLGGGWVWPLALELHWGAKIGTSGTLLGLLPCL